jgi:hypothetical protein
MKVVKREMVKVTLGVQASFLTRVAGRAEERAERARTKRPVERMIGVLAEVCIKRDFLLSTSIVFLG